MQANVARPEVPAGFTLKEAGGRVMIYRAEMETDLGVLMRRSFDQLLVAPDVRRVAEGRAGPIHLPVPGTARRVFVRPYAHGGAIGGALGRAFKDPSRAYGEFAVSCKAQQLGLPVAALLGVTAELRRDGRWEMEAWSWWMPSATSLSLVLPAMAAHPGAARDLLNAAAAALRQCHDAGLVHADLNARNILVDREGGSWRVLLIDLDKARLGPPLNLPVRLKQLARLYRSFAKEGLIPDAVSTEEYGRFAALAAQLPAAAAARFVRACRRATFWHKLAWRTGRLLRKLKRRRAG